MCRKLLYLVFVTHAALCTFCHSPSCSYTHNAVSTAPAVQEIKMFVSGNFANEKIKYQWDPGKLWCWSGLVVCFENRKRKPER